MNHNFLRGAVLAGAVLALAGCGGPSQAPPAPRGDGAQLAVDAGVPGLARAVPQGKPGAAVGLSYDLQGRPAVGQDVPLELVIQPGPQVQALSATITGMPGLGLHGELQAGFEPVSAGELYRHRIIVTPQQPGAFYLTVVITALHEDTEQPQARTFSIPLVVGDPPVQRKSSPPTDAAGEAIESMPAQE